MQTILSDKYLDEIKSIQKNFWGLQNRTISSNKIKNEQKLYDDTKLKFIATVTSEPHVTIGYGSRCQFEIKRNHSYDNMSYYKNLVVKNLRVNEKFVKTISLEINGCLIDKLCNYSEKNTFKMFRDVMNIDDQTIVPFYCFVYNFLPIVFYSQIYIIVEFKQLYNIKDCADEDIKDFSLTYDLYEIEETELGKEYEFLTTQMQFHGIESITNQLMTINTNYNHIIQYFVIESPTNIIEELFIEFYDGGPENILLKPLIIWKDGFYIIPLCPSLNPENMMKYGINFSRVDDAIFRIIFKEPVGGKVDEKGITINEDHRLYIYAINSQIMVNMSEMLCVRHSS